MFYRNLLITFIMYALVMPVWAELGQEEISEQDIAEAVIDPVLDEISPQMEEMTFDTMDSVMTDQATESSAELADTDISETAISEIEVDTPEVSGVKGSPLIKDVVLVLDNSGSMKKNDPQFLTKHAVTEFINNLDESTRAAIIIFDQDVHSAVPLTDISSTSRQGLLDSLSQINYKGLYTNSPAAIESAIYDLKNNGREEARKVIVFMTDGIVDTGNADRDLEKTKWLKEDLAADAADAGIRIFGIAFTENADFELIQSLAQKTEGEYYRALLADDLQNVFSKLNTLINKPDEPEIIEEPQPRIIEKIVERV
ncbi:MAG: VWA domain-containing protein, partial [Gammaproteobacteria bacterium]|nr:VWA domain-containing protein [Gammaproteobacteria bacterium]